MSGIQLEEYLADPRRVVYSAAAEAFRVPPPLDLQTWAVENVEFKRGTALPSDIEGTYNPAKFPFFSRILEVLGPEHPAREVVTKKSAQSGGTVLSMIFMGGYLDREPRDVLCTHPTEGNAKRWAKQKWRRFAMSIKGIKPLFTSQGSKDGGTTTLYQERPDGRGFIQISGANSEASLSMMSADLQVQDDLSKWESNDAGDSESQADSRSKAKRYAKILKISTPLLADNCRISRNYLNSTQERYHVACPHCEATQPLEWEDFQSTITADDPDGAHFTCRDCGGVIEEHHRDYIMDPANGAKWVAENPGHHRIGFHWWTAYSPMEDWGAIARAWLDAEGDPEAEQTFYNDWLGQAYEGAGEAPPWEDLRDRAEKGEATYARGTIPVGGLIVTVGVDVQGNRIEWQAMAWGRDRRRWVIDYGVSVGHITEDETRAEMDKLLARQWPNAWGRRMGVDMLAIDGNYEKFAVLEWAMGHPQHKVMVVRGAKGDGAPDLALVKELRLPNGKVVKRQKRFFNVGVSPMKTHLYENLTKTDPMARGFIGLPAGLGDEYFQMLTAEKRTKVKLKNGDHEYRWVKPEGQPNEALDNHLYAEAAAIRVGWKAMQDSDFDKLAADRERPPEDKQGDLEDYLTRVAPPPTPKGEADTKAAEPASESPWARLARLNRGK